MADDRPLLDPSEQSAAMDQRMSDLEALVNARIARRPTGSMDISFSPTPTDGTLLCNGQPVSRTEYSALFNWASDRGLIGGLFGAGDGSTTFNVPDVRDRFLAGAGGSLAHGATGGAATRALTTTELPAHAHTATTSITAHAAHDHTFTGSTGGSGAHGHSGNTGGAGNHGGHTSGSTNVTQSGSGVTLPANYSGSPGDHTHGVNLGGGDHTHSMTGDVGTGAAMSHTGTVTVNSTGSGAAYDQRPPFTALSILIWT